MQLFPFQQRTFEALAQGRNVILQAPRYKFVNLYSKGTNSV
jgi:hypothetical protein